MSTPLVECIPNFSEARRPEVVEAIQQAIASVPEVTILDRHSDCDHNRTVITYAGPPEAAEEAAFRAIRQAAELINLEQHTGTHPRIGATDVVPFVPISGIDMKACIAIARRLGKRVGTELKIPVYLYEAAARRPERVNLENIRRGQFEGLKLEIQSNPERKPDYGPARLGPAGATVIGTRQPLIAYNVYLTTSNIAIAKSIAKSIRQSSGGLPFVKALGMLVEGRAQVSMNLTDYRQMPVARVVEEIRREAKKHHVQIHHSELVGLIPQAALTDIAKWYLQLEDFQPEQVLEQRLYEVSGQGKGGQDASFLKNLAAGTAAPGGGAAAAYSGAMGAALVAMVARLTIGKKKYLPVETQMKEILLQAEHLREELDQAVKDDSDAFEAVMAAFRLPRDTPRQEKTRSEHIEKATLHASRVPLLVAQKAVSVMALAERCVALGNLNAISDGASAAAMARAAITSASYNVRINLANLQDKTLGDEYLTKLEALEVRAQGIEAQVQKSMFERARLSLA